jgi:aminopeptidase-like protein
MNNMSTYSVPSEAKVSSSPMHDLMTELYPICRSITGNGVRKTLSILQKHIPLTIHEVPTGTQVFDWVVPNEWNIRDAYVMNEQGVKVIDFQKHSLHILNYSIPINQVMSLEELKPHLYTLPDQPDLIPYKTSYYKETWGFCLCQNDFDQLAKGNYQVVIDSVLNPGSLSYGELSIPGKTEDEILISSHICHPSLCNDNLSGLVLATYLAKSLLQKENRYSFRFLFIPGTIGSITWLALHEEQAKKIKHGLVVACVGDPGSIHYKKTRRGNAEIDQAVTHVLEQSGDPFEILEFSPYGYDERQYCSPGINLNVGSLTRTPHGRFPQYHTSADNLDFVQEEFLADTLDKYTQVMDVLEGNVRYMNTNPKCEPQLGKRGLYSTMGGHKSSADEEMALLWVLNQSDGENNLLEIAERARLPFRLIREAAHRLEMVGLLTNLSY